MGSDGTRGDDHGGGADQRRMTGKKIGQADCIDFSVIQIRESIKISHNGKLTVTE